MQDKEERLKKLAKFVSKLLSESYGDQMGYADFYGIDPGYTEALDELALESDLYYRINKEIKIILEDANSKESI